MAVNQVLPEKYEEMRDFEAYANAIRREGLQATDFSGLEFKDEGRNHFLVIVPGENKSSKARAIGQVGLGKDGQIRVQAYGLKNYELLLRLSNRTEKDVQRDISVEMSKQEPIDFYPGRDCL
jgi:hypothetical protein